MTAPAPVPVPVLALGRSVLVLNSLPLRMEPEPAVVTRVWSYPGAEVGMCNLTVFPDQHEPVCKTSVPVFASALHAARHLKDYPGHAPIVAYFPERG